MGLRKVIGNGSDQRRKADGRRIFSVEFKRQAVSQVVSGEKLEVQPAVLRNWMHLVERGGTTAVAAGEDVVPGRMEYPGRIDRLVHARVPNCEANLLKEIRQIVRRECKPVSDAASDRDQSRRFQPFPASCGAIRFRLESGFWMDDRQEDDRHEDLEESPA